MNIRIERVNIWDFVGITAILAEGNREYLVELYS